MSVEAVNGIEIALSNEKIQGNKMRVKVFSLFFVLLQLGETGLYATPLSIDRKEFEQLAITLAPKVNVFADVWAQDPDAVFFGGTSRDYLNWLLGELHKAEAKNELQKKILDLKKLPLIDIRKILGAESDVDVMSSRGITLQGADYGIRKFDSIAPERISAKTDLGQTEINQGFISIEKIQLSKTGLKTPAPFGDGVGDLLSERISIHFADPEAFWNTYYAKLNLNHPILLALRYLRLRASQWLQIHGNGSVDVDELLNFDPKIKNKLKKIIDDAPYDPKFIALIKQERGLKWLNGSVLKSFRSRTNPTAAYKLFSAMGYKELQALFPELASINQFLFVKERNTKKIDENFEKFNVSPEKVYSPVGKIIPEFELFHGTKTDEAFRAILFQNVLPSESGLAGAGLYTVRKDNLKFAVDWAERDINKIVKLEVHPNAKVIDITQGEGKILFDKYRSQVVHSRSQDVYDDFADEFGADILRYPYKTDAFVVKNSAVIFEPQGYARKLMTVEDAVALAKKISSTKDLEEILRLIDFNGFSTREIDYLFTFIPRAKLEESLSDLTKKKLKLKKIAQYIPILPFLREGLHTFVLRLITELEVDEVFAGYYLHKLSSIHKNKIRKLLENYLLNYEQPYSSAKGDLSDIEFIYAYEKPKIYRELISHFIPLMSDPTIEIADQLSDGIFNETLVADGIFSLDPDFFLKQLLMDPKYDLFFVKAFRLVRQQMESDFLNLRTSKKTQPFLLEILDRIIMRGNVDKEILESEILLHEPISSRHYLERSFSIWNTPYYQKWMDHFMRHENPPSKALLKHLSYLADDSVYYSDSTHDRSALKSLNLFYKLARRPDLKPSDKSMAIRSMYKIIHGKLSSPQKCSRVIREFLKSQRLVKQF